MRVRRVARQAFDAGRWRNIAPLHKERVLRRLSQLIADHATEIGKLDVIGSGIIRGFAGLITAFAIDGVDYYSGWPSKIQGGIRSVPGDIAVHTVREPIGVVGSSCRGTARALSWSWSPLRLPPVVQSSSSLQNRRR